MILEYLSVGHRRARAADETLCQPDAVTTAKFGAWTGRREARADLSFVLTVPTQQSSRRRIRQHFEYILVQNRTIRHDRYAIPRNQRSGDLIDRVRQQTKRRALEQAKRVPGSA